MKASVHFAKSGPMMTLAMIAVLIAALYLAKGVLAPVSLAALLSFLLIPGCDLLDRRRLPRGPAVLVTVTLAFALLGAMAWTAVVQISDLAPQMPMYQHNFQEKLHSVNDYVSSALSKVTRTARE